MATINLLRRQMGRSMKVARFCSSLRDDSGPIFNNKNVPMSFISRGKMFKVSFQDQKEFQMFLEKANAVGATPPDEPNCITSKLCELDPSRVHVLVDEKILMKYSKKLAKEKAEMTNCPTDMFKFVDKDYQTDDD